MTTSSTPAENYQSFMDRCEIFFPHAECIKISLAYKLAKFHHRHDTRKDEVGPDGQPLRYFEHVRRVALIGPDEIGIADSDLVILGLLHDSVEDTRIATDEITYLFGPDNCRRILLMSKKPKQGFADRLVRFGDWKVLLVKCCDRLDNIRALTNSTPAFKAKQVRETRAMYYPLLDRLAEIIPEEHRGAPVGWMRTLLRNETERVAGTLSMVEMLSGAPE